MPFGEKLRKLREERGLSQAELAEIINKRCSSQLKRNTISNYERGKSFPDYEKLATLVKIFDTTSDILLDIPSDNITSSARQIDSTIATNANMVEGYSENEPSGSFSKSIREYSQLPHEIKYISVKEHYSYAENYNNRDYIDSLPELILPYNKGHELRAFQIPSTTEHLFINVRIKYGDILIGEKAENSDLNENALFYITIWRNHGVKVMRKFELKQLVNIPDIQEIWVPKAVLTYDEHYTHNA